MRLTLLMLVGLLMIVLNLPSWLIPGRLMMFGRLMSGRFGQFGRFGQLMIGRSGLIGLLGSIGRFGSIGSGSGTGLWIPPPPCPGRLGRVSGRLGHCTPPPPWPGRVPMSGRSPIG